MDVQPLNNFVFPRNPSFLPNCLYGRHKLAANPNCPVYLLEKLADDESGLVRYEVAANPNIPIHLLEKLSVDNDGIVSYGALQNPNCPQYLKDYTKLKNFIEFYDIKF
jgi:hypothetical protein